jgi:hypothetical protein
LLFSRKMKHQREARDEAAVLAQMGYKSRVFIIRPDARFELGSPIVEKHLGCTVEFEERQTFWIGRGAE